MADQIYMDRRSAGKGDSPRPVENVEKFHSEWDRIFGKKTEDIAALQAGARVARFGYP